MEMAKTKVIFALAGLLLLCSCSPRTNDSAGAMSFEWKKWNMDGHRTGVTAVAGSDWESSLGTLDSLCTCYTAPNGVKFTCGSTIGVAKALIDAQPRMAYLKEILAYCPEGMTKYRPESPLSNWTVDALMLGVESKTGRHVDVGVTNFGGIRQDMPDGEVLLDDIVSMFPFDNKMCYVALKGADIRYMFDGMARRGKPECIGGARFAIRDGKACDILVGENPLDDERVYGVATIDFLLDGGDSIFVARNARNLIITDTKIGDWMQPYVRLLGASDEPLEKTTDGRVTIE